MCIMVERGGQEIGRSTRGHGCWFNNWPRAECTAFKQRAGGRPAGQEEINLRRVDCLRHNPAAMQPVRTAAPA